MSHEFQQGIKADDQSLNVQAQTVTIGMGYSDMRALMLDLFKENFPKLRDEAVATAVARVEEITDQFLKRLVETDPNAIVNTSDPDMQLALLQVQREYARSGDRDLGDMLVDVLVDRTKQTGRSLRQLVLNEALNVLPRLTPAGISCLTVLWIFRNVKLGGVGNPDQLYDALEKNISPVIPALGASRTEMRHLEYAGCVSIGIGEIGIIQAIKSEYQGLFCKGFSRTEGGVEEMLPLGIVIPCLRDPSKFQINALSNTDLDLKIYNLGLKDKEARIKALFTTGMMTIPEIEADLRSRVPSLSNVIDLWGASLMKNSDLTSVGIAIAHANWRRATNAPEDIEVWLG